VTRPWLRRIAPFVVALAALLAACSVHVAANSPTATTSPATTGGPNGAGTTSTTTGTRSISWTSCDSDFECAKVEVPVDYQHPDGPKLSIALVKVPATDPSKRIGSLLVNPGGPGGSGIDLAEGNSWPSAIRERFDIVGFDPRGVGRSSPLDCHQTLAEMYHSDPTPRTTAETTHLLQESRTFVHNCATAYRALLPHLGTRDVARDLDQIRLALGEPKLNYLGYSYGTSIGQVYADLYPTHIRAMVLDGIVRLGQPGLEAAADQGRSFERNLDAFEAGCTTDPSCPLGDTAAAVVTRVQAKVEAAPIPAPGQDRPLGPGEFQLGVGQALYSQSEWSSLASALEQADHGNGSDLVRLADAYLQRNPDGSYPNGFEIYFAVSCLDWSWPHDPAAILAAGRATARTAPHLGEGTVTDYVRCAYWPTPPQPLTPPKAVGSPPIVVVSTTNDPATPYVDGVALAKRLPKGVLVTHRGNGHTIYAQGDACVDDAVNQYLITLTPPTNGLVCG
jgi:pimeloyl-ACP methyl ester carboxylesterase